METVKKEPVYPDCKGTNKDKKACFEKKIRKFVARKYNADLGNTIAKGKKQRIRVLF